MDRINPSGGWSNFGESARLIAGVAVMSAIVCGCSALPNSDEQPNDALVQGQSNLPARVETAEDSPVESPVESPAIDDVAAPPKVAETTVQDAQFERSIDQARRDGLLDVAAEEQLRDLLRDVSPGLRPGMLDTFLALRRRDAEQRTAARPATDDKRPAARIAAAPTRRDPAADGQAGADAENPLRNDWDPEAPLRAAPADRLGGNSQSGNGRAAHEQSSQARSESTALYTAPHARHSEQDGRPHEVSDDFAKQPVQARPIDARQGDAPQRRPSAAGRASGSAQDDWQTLLDAAIRSLDEQLREAPEGQSPDDPADNHARLRMLQLVAGRRDDALTPIPGLEAAGKEFWSGWLYGMSTYLDDEAIPDERRRATLAADQLREAVARVGEQGNLDLRNIAFCREVVGFGDYDRYVAKSPRGAVGDARGPAKTAERYVFYANQEVLLYAEVRNFASLPSAQGFHTALSSRYEIVDRQNRRFGPVYQVGESHDYCQNRRGDFFVRYHMNMPAQIPSGEYTLKLTVEDLHGGKQSQAAIAFTITDKR